MPRAGTGGGSPWQNLKLSNESPSTFHLKYLDLNSYTSVLIEGETPVTIKDIVSLTHIGDDKKLPLVHRMHAKYALEICKTLVGDKDGAVSCLRDALSVREEAGVKYRKMLVTNPEMVVSKISCGELMDEMGRNAERKLAILEGKGDGRRWDDREEIQKKIERGVLDGRVMDVNEITKRLKVGADHCDQCGIKREDAVKLKMCGRCRMVFYCSEKCARSAWKSMHKKNCRAPEQMEVGDWVQICTKDASMKDVESYNVMDEAVVEVLEKVNEDQLKIGIVGGADGQDLKIPVPKKLLRRTRPKTTI